MKKFLSNLRWAVAAGTVLTIPFMILEWVNRRAYVYEDYPIPLFGIMCFMPLTFTLILLPALQKVREGNKKTIWRISLLPAAILLVLIASFWVYTIIDQMPCFLGVPVCD